MARRVSTDAWVERTTVPKGKVVVEEQEAFSMQIFSYTANVSSILYVIPHFFQRTFTPR